MAACFLKDQEKDLKFVILTRPEKREVLDDDDFFPADDITQPKHFL